MNEPKTYEESQIAALTKERDELLNRLMARDLPQFQYYQTKFKQDVAEVKAVQDENREERKEAKKEGEDEDDPDSLF